MYPNSISTTLECGPSKFVIIRGHSNARKYFEGMTVPAADRLDWWTWSIHGEAPRSTCGIGCQSCECSRSRALRPHYTCSSLNLCRRSRRCQHRCAGSDNTSLKARHCCSCRRCWKQRHHQLHFCVEINTVRLPSECYLALREDTASFALFHESVLSLSVQGSTRQVLLDAYSVAGKTLAPGGIRTRSLFPGRVLRLTPAMLFDRTILCPVRWDSLKN